MKDKSHITDFINNVVNNNYKQADKALSAVVTEKLKARIRSIDKSLAKSK